MASRKANEAVAAYRQLLLAEQKVAEIERTVKKLGAQLSEEDFQAYARMTANIDEQLDVAVDATLDYSGSTRVAYIRAAINRSGLDRDVAAR